VGLPGALALQLGCAELVLQDYNAAVLCWMTMRTPHRAPTPVRVRVRASFRARVRVRVRVRVRGRGRGRGRVRVRVRALRTPHRA